MVLTNVPARKDGQVKDMVLMVVLIIMNVKVDFELNLTTIDAPRCALLHAAPPEARELRAAAVIGRCRDRLSAN